VAFKPPPEMDKQYVKRVIGLPRERIRIEQGQVYINDRPLQEPWIENNTVFGENNNAVYFTAHGNYPERTVPDDHYFVMGDNRNNSLDSRSWGFLPRDYVLGKPWRIYWSYESTSEEYLTPGLKHKIRDIFRTIKNFFRKTRWKRTFLKIR
jgi:signal peptidase I